VTERPNSGTQQSGGNLAAERADMDYAYPQHLASFVRERWSGTVPNADPLPDREPVGIA
jgi:hypothetical protein